MRTEIRRPIAAFVALILMVSIGYAERPPWPLKGTIDLSSSFGDYRQGRLHAGLDLRTGGVPGASVYSPVDGYVSRIKMAYTGYGKGLYLKGDDGFLYVFGHLHRFADTLDRRVKTEQIAQKRYYVDIEFPADSVRVKAGDLLAYSGQTGAGAPHLHFEKRTIGNFPLNPLTNGYPAQDKSAPVFRRIGFQATDSASLLASGRRKEIFPVKAKGGRDYVFDGVPYFNRPFGLLADCSDRLRKDGLSLNVHRLNLYVDDRLWYETVFDTVDYATTSSANLEYDFQEAAGDHSFVRRLFRAPGNEYAGSRGMDGGDGTIGGTAPLAVGWHKGRIEAIDAAGNSSRLTFSFVWGPADGVYRLDSTEVVNDSNWVFHFTPKIDVRLLDIDSALVFANKKGVWGPVPTVAVKIEPDGRLTADVGGHLIDRRVFALALYTGSGCRIDEEPFNGIMDPGTDRIGVTHEINADGLIATINAGALLGAVARLELYYQGKLLGVEYPSRYFTMYKYHFFVPPRPKYARVDLLKGILSLDTARRAVACDTVNLAVVGWNETDEVTIDTNTTLIFHKRGLFDPRFIEFNVNEIRFRSPLRLNSDHYKIMPEVMALREPFEIRMKYFSPLPDSARTELYRLDTAKNRWVRINDWRDGSVIVGKTDRGGSFAAVYDFDPPIISNLSPSVGQRVRDLRPIIRFTMTDSLSGFEDDRNILIKLDGKWQIPEYDPETGICQTQPMEPLIPGTHHIAVEITDRVGNKAAQYLKFMVQQPAPARKKQ